MSNGLKTPQTLCDEASHLPRELWGQSPQTLLQVAEVFAPPVGKEQEVCLHLGVEQTHCCLSGERRHSQPVGRGEERKRCFHMFSVEVNQAAQMYIIEDSLCLENILHLSDFCNRK